MQKKILALLLVSFATISLQAKLILDTVWGQEIMDHPLLEELVLSPAMQRLKGIDQSGPTTYIPINTPTGTIIEPPFSRFDHCIGVWALLKRAGAPLEEQVAGLLHDASHTAFSHLADVLFYHDETMHEGSYQDSIHEWFLEQMEIPTLTIRYGIQLKQLNPDNSTYKALERPQPNLCADRIQYLIHTGVIFNKITNEQAKELVEDLKFSDGRWFFRTVSCAQTFAYLSLDFTKNLYGSAYNHVFYQFFSSIIREAFKQGLFTFEEFHFGTDKEILNKITASNNPLIQTLLARCYNLFDHFTVVPYGQGDYNFKPKCRGVDPLIKTGENNYQRLTEVDADYKKAFEETKTWCKTGYGIIVTPV